MSTSTQDITFGFIFGATIFGGLGVWGGSYMGTNETKKDIYYQAHKAGLGEYQISPVTGQNEFKWKADAIKEGT